MFVRSHRPVTPAPSVVPASSLRQFVQPGQSRLQQFLQQFSQQQ